MDGLDSKEWKSVVLPKIYEEKMQKLEAELEKKVSLSSNVPEVLIYSYILNIFVLRSDQQFANLPATFFLLNQSRDVVYYIQWSKKRSQSQVCLFSSPFRWIMEWPYLWMLVPLWVSFCPPPPHPSLAWIALIRWVERKAERKGNDKVFQNTWPCLFSSDKSVERYQDVLESSCKQRNWVNEETARTWGKGLLLILCR